MQGIITYRTLYKVGHWASVDARCTTEVSILVGHSFETHHVRVALITKYGEVAQLGCAIFSEYVGSSVSDEDGKIYPDLDAAIRAYAEHATRLSRMPGHPTSSPLRYECYDGSVRSVFDKPLDSE